MGGHDLAIIARDATRLSSSPWGVNLPFAPLISAIWLRSGAGLAHGGPYIGGPLLCLRPHLQVVVIFHLATTTPLLFFY